MTLRVISTNQTNTTVGGEIVNNVGSPNLTVGTGDEVVVLENVTLAADGSLVDVTALDDFDFIMNGDGFAGSNAFRIDYQSSLSNWDFEVSLTIGNDATIATNINLGFFGVLATGSTYLQDDSEFTFSNAGTATATQGRGFEFQTIVTVDAANTGTVTVGDGPAFLFESVLEANFVNTGTLISNQDTPALPASHLEATVAFNSATENMQFSNTGTIIGQYTGVVSEVYGVENIVNAGTIIGDVYTSNLVGGDLRNSGLIQGDVYTRIGDDTVVNTGVIEGTMDLGAGNDVYKAGGDGLVSGQIIGGTGDDTIFGGEADENIDGGEDDDLIRGNGGEDNISGGLGEDNVNGGDGDDTISGGDDGDVLRGGAGDDEIKGDAGGDKLYGGAGADEITGGAGKDVMRGNGGADTFIFSSSTDADTGSNVDRIRDFEQGIDKIDISAIATFEFVGDASFSGTGLEVRYQTTNTGLRFEMDVNGDGIADMRINMNGVSDLLESDFFL